jgi:hypothetical protein
MGYAGGVLFASIPAPRRDSEHVAPSPSTNMQSGFSFIIMYILYWNEQVRPNVYDTLSIFFRPWLHSIHPRPSDAPVAATVPFAGHNQFQDAKHFLGMIDSDPHLTDRTQLVL